jgi:hypothetical protein
MLIGSQLVVPRVADVSPGRLPRWGALIPQNYRKTLHTACDTARLHASSYVLQRSLIKLSTGYASAVAMNRSRPWVPGSERWFRAITNTTLFPATCIDLIFFDGG